MLTKAEGRRVVGSLRAELAGAQLGDARLTRRLLRLVEQVAGQPWASFPALMRDPSQLEGAYRFFSNERVEADAILAPHIEATAERASRHERVLVLHDTTEFEFKGERAGLGRLLRRGQGFFGHFALAAGADGTRQPLGVLGLEPLVRDKPAVGHKNWTPDKSRGEGLRWQRLVEASEEALAGRSEAVHVMDREGDRYALLDSLDGAGRKFVIRSNHNRVVQTKTTESKLHDLARRGRFRLERRVELSSRPDYPGPKGIRSPARKSRIVTLSFSATAVQIKRTSYAREGTPELNLNVVRVKERQPPKGQDAVEWLLLTNLPVDSDEELAFVVDAYRTRWMIEEYFKALKSGCSYEQRQLESFHALLNALAVFVPIAWQMLALRHLSHHAPKGRASAVLAPVQLDVLRATAGIREGCSVRDAMFAIARIGGHLTSNGDPGWSTLARGFHTLSLMEAGWRAREGPEM